MVAHARMEVVVADDARLLAAALEVADDARLLAAALEVVAHADVRSLVAHCLRW